MKTEKELKNLLMSIDRKGYPAYKQTKGEYAFDGYILSIDHVQGDPFASPSKVSVKINARTAGYPKEYYRDTHRRIALQDMLTRRFAREIARGDRHDAGSGKSGLILSSRPGQEILERTSCRIVPDTGEVIYRMEMGFPAFGRSINARGLIHMLYDQLPEYVDRALIYHKNEERKYLDTLYLADDQLAVRKAMEDMGPE